MTERKSGEQGISDEAVKEKTGKVWSEWFKLLDDWEAQNKDHAAIAKYLWKEVGIEHWWAQTVTVRYEQERGLRVVGQKSDGSFEFSIQRTIAVSQEQAYDAVTDPKLVSIWFTTNHEAALEVGGSYSNADGDHGKYLALDRPTRIRFTWENEKHCPGTVVEITVAEKGPEKCTVAIMHSKLKDETGYSDMKHGWSWAIESLKSYLETGAALPYEEWVKAQETSY
jgi:uncharacterized protein YndB with AHSA1/START domain